MRNITIMNNVFMQSVTYYLIQTVPIVSEHRLQLTVADTMTEKCISYIPETLICVYYFTTFCHPEERVWL